MNHQEQENSVYGDNAGRVWSDPQFEDAPPEEDGDDIEDADEHGETYDCPLHGCGPGKDCPRC